jgi:hypothetical protein
VKTLPTYIKEGDSLTILRQQNVHIEGYENVRNGILIRFVYDFDLLPFFPQMSHGRKITHFQMKVIHTNKVHTIYIGNCIGIAFFYAKTILSEKRILKPTTHYGS